MLRCLATALTLAVLPSRLHAEPVTFRIEEAGAGSVALAGEFNNWKPQEMVRDAGGAWSRTLELPPGTYAYKFVVNGKHWLFDPENPARKMAGGNDNSAVVVGDGVFRPSGLTGQRERRFRFSDASAREVFVAGSFNGWNTASHPMVKNPDGIWETLVLLPTGDTAYKFIVDGRWTTDPANPRTEPDGQGGSNSVVTVDGFHATNAEPRVSFLHTVYAFTHQMRTCHRTENSSPWGTTARSSSGIFPRGKSSGAFRATSVAGSWGFRSRRTGPNSPS